MDKFCIKVPISNGTQYLITRVRHKSNIVWDKIAKIDLDGGKNA